MPKEDKKILKYNHGEKSMKVSFIVYSNLESLLEKTRSCHNNPKKSPTNKINKHRPSGYSLLTPCSFEAANNELDYYRGHDCMEKFCKDLKELAAKIKEMIPLTHEENKSYQNQKVCHICKKNLVLMMTIKNTIK